MTVDYLGLDHVHLVKLVENYSREESVSLLYDYFSRLLLKDFDSGDLTFNSSGETFGIHGSFQRMGTYIINFAGFHGREEYFSELEQKISSIGFYTGALTKSFSFTGLLREEYSWLMRKTTDVVDGELIISIVPSKHIADYPCIKECSNIELLSLYADYRQGVIDGLSFGFEYSKSVYNYLQNYLNERNDSK